MEAFLRGYYFFFFLSICCVHTLAQCYILVIHHFFQNLLFMEAVSLVVRPSTFLGVKITSVEWEGGGMQALWFNLAC